MDASRIAFESLPPENDILIPLQVARDESEVEAATVGVSLCNVAHRFLDRADARLVLPSESGDPIVNAYRAGESPNEYMLDILTRTTDEGDWVVDLGCHVGTFAIGAAALRRNVVAIDASPLHCNLVRRSVRSNAMDNLEVHWVAVDAFENEVRVIEDGLFSRVAGAADVGGRTVPAMTLDDIAAQFVPARVAFLKMDIEGAEISAVNSGEAFLRASGPVVLFESNGMTLALSGSSVSLLREAFERIGYKVFRTEGDRWIHCPVDQIQPEAWVDMIALTTPDQARWASLIDWHWSEEAILRKIADWAALPHVNTRRYLVDEISRGSVPGGIEAQVDRIRMELEMGLASQ